MVILWYLKNNFIFLVKKILIFVNYFKKQNAFPPYPIVTDSLVSFQYEGQLSFV